MTAEKRSDKLLQRLLGRHETVHASVQKHPDEETLALFVDGDLPPRERESLVEHLSTCDACRRLASLVMTANEEPSQFVLSPKPLAGWFVEHRSLLAIAAATLLMVASGIYWLASPRPTEAQFYAEARQRLEARDYDGARNAVASAKQRGLISPRLRNLDAQAVRHMPYVVALASAGRLSDFGKEIGGIAARSAPNVQEGERLQKASEIMAEAGNQDLAVLLNRGHLMLSQGEDAQAAAEFEAAIKLKTEEPLAWLGKGLAAYLQDDLHTAEVAFRRGLELDSKNLAAAMNLAMTLEELNRPTEAAAAWRDALKLQLDAEDRARIETHFQQLPGNRP